MKIINFEGWKVMSKASYRLQAKVTKLYVDMRLKRMSKLDWMIATEETIETLRQLEPTNIVSQLFYAQLLITKEAYAAADEILKSVEQWLNLHSNENPACLAYYLYLTTLMQDDAAYDMRVTKKLHELSAKHPNLWQISWLIYYLDHALSADITKQYQFLKKMFLSGCRSPLMYAEARILIERNPAFLYGFSEFEAQTMVFVLRHTKMSQRVCEILTDLMAKRTDFRYIYLVILRGCYEANPNEELLKNICKLFIRGGCKGAMATTWYRKAIASHVEMTGLYQAFMKSLPIEKWQLDGEELSEERKIPQEVLEYFAHASELDDVRTAYLYAYVHKYKDKWFSIYRLYEPLVQPFMMEALYKGQVNAGLAYLYEHLLKAAEVPAEYVETFLDICHSCKVSNLPMVEGLLTISYHHLNQELQMPFTNGEAILPLYGEEFTLSVRSHMGSVLPLPNAHIEPLIDKSIWRTFFEEAEIANSLYHLARVEQAIAKGNTETVIPSVKHLIYHEDIEQSFKEEAAKRVLSYWDVNGAYEEITEAAPYVFNEYGAYSKQKEIAFWKKQYLQNYIGMYGMQILIDHYEGSLQEKTSLFMKARSMGVKTGNYGEDILLGMVQNKELIAQHQEVLEDYVASTTKNLEVLQQYLEFATETYYMSDKCLESKYIQILGYFAKQDMEFKLIAKLAYLQGIIQLGVANVSQDLLGVATRYIEELLKDNVYFSWMQPLRTLCPALVSKQAYQVLVYKGTETGPVWVRFVRYGLGNQDVENYQSEVLEPVCDNVYAKSFILYYGERMHYEIYSLEGTEHKLLKQGVLQRGQDFLDEGDDRYAKLNHMIRLHEEGKDKELFDQLENYYGESAMVEQLFTLK